MTSCGVYAPRVTRWFNTAGFCTQGDHYMLPPARRVPHVRTLVERKAYFIVHAPRQVGKTTSLIALAAELTASGQYVAVVVSMIVAANRTIRGPEDLGLAESAVLSSWRRNAEHDLPPDLQPPPWPAADPGQRITAAMTEWARVCPRPLVLFVDEFDALRGDLLVGMMRQLQAGYRDRPQLFPWALALIGLRDMKDYRFDDDGLGRLNIPSPFNIVVASVTLPFFTEADVTELYAQHTADTGQVFEPAAIARVMELTGGQPWLVNALAAEATDVLAIDRSVPVTAVHIDQAKENLLARRTTHLDNLSDKLSEPRVRGVIEPMLAGDNPDTLPSDDVRYLVDLGLLRITPQGGLDVSNPMYREVIARELAFVPRATLPQIAPTWLTAAGRLDSEKLLTAFVAFWRRHGEPLLRAAPYAEVASHLVLMAFLDRVANGGGTLEREYAIGRGRMDLCLRRGPDVLAIEIKVWRDHRPDPLAEGLEQLDGYLAGLGLGGGWLVLFDTRAGQPPIEERTSVERAVTAGGRAVAVIRA